MAGEIPWLLNTNTWANCPPEEEGVKPLNKVPTSPFTNPSLRVKSFLYKRAKIIVASPSNT